MCFSCHALLFTHCFAAGFWACLRERHARDFCCGASVGNSVFYPFQHHSSFCNIRKKVGYCVQWQWQWQRFWMIVSDVIIMISDMLFVLLQCVFASNFGVDCWSFHWNFQLQTCHLACVSAHSAATTTSAATNGTRVFVYWHFVEDVVVVVDVLFFLSCQTLRTNEKVSLMFALLHNTTATADASNDDSLTLHVQYKLPHETSKCTLSFSLCCQIVSCLLLVWLSRAQSQIYRADGFCLWLQAVNQNLMLIGTCQSLGLRY